MKNQELVRRLEEWIEGGRPQAPYTLQLNPTMACDLNCIFCRRQDELKAFYAEHREIPNGKYVQMVRDALEMGTKSVIIKGGGEPLLRRSLLFEIIPLIKSYGACGTLVTNGTHMDEGFCRLFASCRWDQINFSLDGADAAVQDELRAKRGVFSRIIEALERFRAIKSAPENPQLGFHCVLTKKNYRQLGQYIDLAARHGVSLIELDTMSLRWPANFDRGDLDLGALKETLKADSPSNRLVMEALESSAGVGRDRLDAMREEFVISAFRALQYSPDLCERVDTAALILDSATRERVEALRADLSGGRPIEVDRVGLINRKILQALYPYETRHSHRHDGAKALLMEEADLTRLQELLPGFIERANRHGIRQNFELFIRKGDFQRHDTTFPFFSKGDFDLRKLLELVRKPGRFNDTLSESLGDRSRGSPEEERVIEAFNRLIRSSDLFLAETFSAQELDGMARFISRICRIPFMPEELAKINDVRLRNRAVLQSLYASAINPSSVYRANDAAAVGRVPCYYPWHQAAVTPAGHLVPCCYAEETHQSRINLRDVPFRQAWVEGDAEEYRKSMLEGTMMPFCRHCTAMYAENNAQIRQWLEEEHGS